MTQVYARALRLSPGDAVEVHVARRRDGEWQTEWLPAIFLAYVAGDEREDFQRIVKLTDVTDADGCIGRDALRVDSDNLGAYERHVDWVIVGGESGHGARIMNIEWARALRDQCRKAGVAFFMKQVGAQLATVSSKGGDVEDIPPDLLVREWPTPSNPASIAGCPVMGAGSIEWNQPFSKVAGVKP